ncbi:acyl-CoA dehydrogenase domain-containing protein [Escherichia coli]
MKRYDDEGRNEADLPLVHWGVQDALYQAEQAMDDLLQNFPNRVVAGLLNVVIFPTGHPYWHLLTSWIIKWRRLPVPNAFPHWSRSVPDAERA